MKASLDRGFGRCQAIRKHSTMIKTYPNRTYDRLVTGPEQEIEKFALIESDGLAGVGDRITTGQIFINKQTPMETNPRVSSTAGDDGPSTSLNQVDPSAIPYKSTPMTYKYPGYSVIDKVFDIKLIANCENLYLFILFYYRFCSQQMRKIKILLKFSFDKRVVLN